MDAPMSDTAKITLFIDEDCPFCHLEYSWLSRLNKEEKVSFIDISAEDFDPDAFEMSMSDFESSIKARWEDGVWVDGVEAFRAVYGVLGFKKVVAFSRCFPIALLLSLLYAIFRRLRVPFGTLLRVPLLLFKAKK